MHAREGRHLRDGLLEQSTYIDDVVRTGIVPDDHLQGAPYSDMLKLAKRSTPSIPGVPRSLARMCAIETQVGIGTVECANRDGR